MPSDPTEAPYIISHEVEEEPHDVYHEVRGMAPATAPWQWDSEWLLSHAFVAG